MRRPGVALLAGASMLSTQCAHAAQAPSAATPAYATVKVWKTLPHDPAAFTEGLEVRGTKVYESSGLYDHSDIRIADLRTGRVLRSVRLPRSLFAEGLTVLPSGEVLQLTWKEKVVIVRNATTLAEKKRLPLEGEGWGVCWSDSLRRVVRSDGSATLTLHDPSSFAATATIAVKLPDGTGPTNINELECVGTHVFANVWTTKTVLEIDTATGTVVRVIDAGKLGPAKVASADDVLNGIALLPNGHFLLTGKRWPKSYEVSFVDQSAPTTTRVP